MKIKRLAIRNFRSFADFSIDLEGESLFVIGENAGGKTSLLTAAARALGRDLNFTAADFLDRDQPIEIEITLTDLDPDQRGKLANYVDFGGGAPSLRVAATAIWDQGSEEAEVEHHYPHTVGSRSNREQRDSLSWQWLPSARDPARMLQFGVTRNLMSKLVDGLAIDQSLDNAVVLVRQASAALGADVDLARFLAEAGTDLAALLPNVAAEAFSMGISATTGRDLLRQFELMVEHLGEAVPVSTQSSGIAQLAIFIFAMKLAQTQPGTVLLIDEPEISLHPQAQRALMRALRELNIQMIVATHSANLLDRADPRRVVRLHRTAAGIGLASPSTLTNDEARHLARFTSPHTAEAFFASAVILVEGMSDQLALEALAERFGRNLDAEGVTVVPMGGASAIGSFLRLFGPTGFKLPVAGLCDESEEQLFIGALEDIGLGAALTRQTMEALGFYVCCADLEDELVDALGVATVEALIAQEGDTAALQLFKQQPKYRDLGLDQQLRRFVGRGRKIQYAPLLVDALDLQRTPRALREVLARV